MYLAYAALAVATTVISVGAIYYINKDAFGAMGNAAVNAFNDTIHSIGNLADSAAAQLMSAAEDIARKVAASFARVRVRGQYKQDYEWHHLVAQGSKKALHARWILHDVGINVNGSLNMVYIKTGLHRRIHNSEYYEWTNTIIIDAYNAAGRNKALQKHNVILALIAIRSYVDALSEAAPF